MAKKEIYIKNKSIEEEILERCKNRLPQIVYTLCKNANIREDLLAEAEKALWEAIQNFDEKKSRKGVPHDIDSLEKAIWSYAYLRIKGAVIQGSIDNIYDIKRYEQRQLKAIQDIHDEIMQETGSYVTAQEILQRIQEKKKILYNQGKDPNQWLPQKWEDQHEIQTALEKLKRPFMGLSRLEPMTIDELEDDEDWQIAVEILDSIPIALSREILQKKFLQEKTYLEIAREVALTQDKVRTRLSKILNFLRTRCQQYCHKDRLSICRAILNISNTLPNSFENSQGNPHET